MDVSVMPSSALPLNLPADFALVSLPIILAPRRITPRPSTMMGSAREATTRCSGSLFFELTDWSTVTLRVVPAGTMMGGAGSFGAGACSATGLALFTAAPLLLLDGEELHPYKASSEKAQIEREILTLCMNS
jgi:hypothetical protein